VVAVPSGPGQMIICCGWWYSLGSGTRVAFFYAEDLEASARYWRC